MSLSTSSPYRITSMVRTPCTRVRARERNYRNIFAFFVGKDRKIFKNKKKQVDHCCPVRVFGRTYIIICHVGHACRTVKYTYAVHVCVCVCACAYVVTSERASSRRGGNRSTVNRTPIISSVTYYFWTRSAE